MTLTPDELIKGISFAKSLCLPRISKVVVWLNGFDVDNSGDWRSCVASTDITAKGFTLKGGVWGSTELREMGVTWIAYSASHSRIDCRWSNDWQKPQHEHSKKVTLSKSFERVPWVFYAVNRVDYANKSNLRLKAYVKDVTTKGMSVHLDS